jgi:hypothetical protein
MSGRGGDSDSGSGGWDIKRVSLVAGAVAAVVGVGAYAYKRYTHGAVMGMICIPASTGSHPGACKLMDCLRIIDRAGCR